MVWCQYLLLYGASTYCGVAPVPAVVWRQYLLLCEASTYCGVVPVLDVVWCRYLLSVVTVITSRLHKYYGCTRHHNDVI